MPVPLRPPCAHTTTPVPTTSVCRSWEIASRFRSTTTAGWPRRSSAEPRLGPLRPPRQLGREGAEGAAAVRHGVLLLRPHLGEGPPVAAVRHEYGVVAKAVGPPP